MNKFKIIIFFILFILNPIFADVYNSPSTLENISKRIPPIRSIKCNFRQEKYLQNIANPIISSGNFEFIENQGIYFNTLYPIKASIDYTNKNYKQINDIINAISEKKYSKLEKEFNFYFEGDINNWSLGMKPKKISNTYNYLSFITINGTDYINKITLQQTNGNKIILWFTK